MALVKVGLRETAKDICHSKGLSTKVLHQKNLYFFAGVNLIKYLEATIPGSIPAESILRYAEHLKQRYRRLPTQTDGWPPD